MNLKLKRLNNRRRFSLFAETRVFLVVKNYEFE
jgi:hypothetical protein